MSNYCTVPDCKNKNSDLISVFKCPDDTEIREKWKNYLILHGKKSTFHPL